MLRCAAAASFPVYNHRAITNASRSTKRRLAAHCCTPIIPQPLPQPSQPPPAAAARWWSLALAASRPRCPASSSGETGPPAACQRGCQWGCPVRPARLLSACSRVARPSTKGCGRSKTVDQTSGLAVAETAKRPLSLHKAGQCLRQAMLRGQASA